MKRENAAKRYYKRNMIIFIAVFVPLILFFFIPAFAFMNSEVKFFELFMLPISISVVAIPFIIYYIVKFIHYSNVKFVNIKKAKSLIVNHITMAVMVHMLVSSSNMKMQWVINIESPLNTAI